jgi:hypothetical protein
MKAYSNEKLNMNRLQAMDRALMASRLVQPQFYEKTEKAIKGPDGKGPNKDLFLGVCKDARITDTELIEHMWDIVVAAKKVYMGQSPGIIW